MTKFKHNKKRNTAFLYEALVLELTKAILKSDHEAKNKITSLIKESFCYGSTLHRDLKLYHSIINTEGVHSITAEKILQEVKRAKESIDPEGLLSEQVKLVKRVKKQLSDDVFSNFVPNYKTLATVSQIFNKNAPIKTRVLLENDIIGKMSHNKGSTEDEKMVPMDSIIFKTFAKKFNEQYRDELHEEQKQLLAKYISSFSDNGLELKLYLNEEIKRLKENLKISLGDEVFLSDENMLSKIKEVIVILENFKQYCPDKNMIQRVIKIQNLVREVRMDAPH